MFDPIPNAHIAHMQQNADGSWLVHGIRPNGYPAHVERAQTDVYAVQWARAKGFTHVKAEGVLYEL